jgi:hypothetical protein
MVFSRRYGVNSKIRATTLFLQVRWLLSDLPARGDLDVTAVSPT